MRDDRLYEIEYGYWFNLINERVYHQLDVLLNLVQLVGGSAAALAAMQNLPGVVVAAGLALALCAALALLVQPSVKAEQHKVCKQQWRTLRGRAESMTDTELLLAVTDLQGQGPSGFDLLADPARNATVRASGQPEAQKPLTLLQRVLS